MDTQDRADTGATDEEAGDGGSTYQAGDGLTDEEMIDQVAEQTDSASTRAYDAGKDWDGKTDAPDPNAGGS